MTNRQHMLRSVGSALYGESWQRALAADLGPLHPDGPRDSIDDRLVRRWTAGDRDIPDWVGGALRDICERRQVALGAAIRDLDQW